MIVLAKEEMSRSFISVFKFTPGSRLLNEVFNLIYHSQDHDSVDNCIDDDEDDDIS